MIIENYPNYFVTKEGKVINVKTNKILKPSFNTWGYQQVTLHNRIKSKNIVIHRLVANAFIPKPAPTFGLDGKEIPLEVNHKNGNKKDNHVDNLEWATRQENITHAFVVLGRESVTRPMYYDGVLYKSIKECSRTNGFSHNSLCMTLSKGRTKYKGKTISYAKK
jgi:hypothetical protein